MYGIQVKIRTYDDNSADYVDEWRWCHPTHGQPYKYDTRTIAENVARSIYPGLEHRDDVRVAAYPGELGEEGIVNNHSNITIEEEIGDES